MATSGFTRSPKCHLQQELSAPRRGHLMLSPVGVASPDANQRLA